MGVMEDLARAREAFERREWAASYEALCRREPATLPPRTSRGWPPPPCCSAGATMRAGLQRAYQVNVAAGTARDARPFCAFWLAMVLVEVGEDAVGSGWVARGERLLAGLEGDMVEHGYLDFHQLLRAVHRGQFDEADRLAAAVTGVRRAVRRARTCSSSAGPAQGRLMIIAGRVAEGLALLDEAMIGVSAGEVSTVVAGEVYCLMIEACQEIFDFGRVVQWTEQLSRLVRVPSPSW